MQGIVYVERLLQGKPGQSQRKGMYSNNPLMQGFLNCSRAWLVGRVWRCEGTINPRHLHDYSYHRALI